MDTRSYTMECGYSHVEELRKAGYSGNIVILTRKDTCEELRKTIVSVLPEGSSCNGKDWTVPNGSKVMVRSTIDALDVSETFALRVCVGGQKLEEKESENVRVWRDKAVYF